VWFFIKPALKAVLPLCNFHHHVLSGLTTTIAIFLRLSRVVLAWARVPGNPPRIRPTVLSTKSQTVPQATYRWSIPETRQQWYRTVKEFYSLPIYSEPSPRQSIRKKRKTPTEPVCLPGYDRFSFHLQSLLHGNHVTVFTYSLIFVILSHFVIKRGLCDAFCSQVCVKLISGKFADWHIPGVMLLKMMFSSDYTSHEI
jgi:hypothetical protein